MGQKGACALLVLGSPVISPISGFRTWKLFAPEARSVSCCGAFLRTEPQSIFLRYLLSHHLCSVACKTQTAQSGRHTCPRVLVRCVHLDTAALLVPDPLPCCRSITWGQGASQRGVTDWFPLVANWMVGACASDWAGEAWDRKGGGRCGLSAVRPSSVVEWDGLRSGHHVSGGLQRPALYQGTVGRRSA